MIGEIYQNIIYFLNLTLKTELLWVVLPLAIATIVMLFYSEKYKGECPGWNSYVSNSLVLLFVAVILLRFVYEIDGNGLINFVNYPMKTGVSLIVLIMGAIVLLLNFEHYFPEKIARQVSSPLTLNIIAYIIILFVYSNGKVNALNGHVIAYSPVPMGSPLVTFLSLIILLILVLAVLNLIKFPIKKLFTHLKKMKEREKIDNFIEEKKKIMTKKREIKKEETKLKKTKLRELNKQKREAIKLKKIIKK